MMKNAILLLSLLALPVRAQVDVPLTHDVPQGIAAGRWPVTFGVPFPKDALRADAKLTVTADGKPIPTQTTPLATWDKQGGSVRWLLVDCQIDAANPPQVMRLTEAASPRTALKHREDNGAMVVDTGAATFRIEANPLRVTRDGRPMRFTLMDQNEKAYVASGDDSLVVEDHGAQRIALRSEGWFRAADGSTFCRHITRLHFFADLATVRVLHTFIMTETGEDHRVRDLAVELPTAGGETTFGIDAGDLSKTHTVSGDAHLVQDCTDRWHLSWQLHDGGAIAATGEKYGGWAHRGGVTAAIREAWQNYPNEIEARGEQLIVHLWPRHGRAMDFTTRAMLATYGEDGVEAIDRFFLGKPKPYTKSIDDIDNNAMGVAKTHELWLDFSGEMNAALPHQANTPLLAMADPAWNCASGALLSPMHPYDPQRFPRVEAMLDAAFDKYLIWQKHFSDYGWADYGDVHCGARRNDFGLNLEGGDMATPWRYWDSTHYGFPNGPWTLYYRSGNRKYLQFAEANARHCMDIDRCHFGDGEVRLKGTQYYCDWSIIHWNGVPPTYVWLTTYDKVEYLAYAYYMRGDRRALEVFKDYGEAASLYHDDATRQFPLRMLQPRYKNVRHFGPPLGNLTELYRITWNERYLDMARDYAAAITEMMPDDETLQTNLGGLAYCWEGLARYVEVTGDATFLESAKRYATEAARGGSHRFSYGPYALGFALTGDTAMLDLGKTKLMALMSILDVSDRFDYRGDGGYWACGDHPYTLRSLPVFLGAMMGAPKAWRDANLPLLETSDSIHFAGPRHPAVHFKVTGPKPRLAFQLFQEQAAVLNGGEPVEAPANRYVELDPAAFTGGVNTVTFPLRPTRKMDDYIDRGNVNLVAAEDMKVVIGPDTESGAFCVFAPRLFFFVPGDVDEFTVTVQVSDTWAAYAWAPLVNLFDADGNAVETQTGPGTLVFTVKPDAAHRGRCWSIGPIGRVSAPKETATWHKPVYPFEKHFPSYITLSDNLPQRLASRPEMMFDPETE